LCIWRELNPNLRKKEGIVAGEVVKGRIPFSLGYREVFFGLEGKKKNLENVKRRISGRTFSRKKGTAFVSSAKKEKVLLHFCEGNAN